MLPIILIQSISITEMTEIVISSQMAKQIIIFIVALITEVAERMTSVRSVVCITFSSVQSQFWPCVAPALPCKYLPESIVTLEYAIKICVEVYTFKLSTHKSQRKSSCSFRRWSLRLTKLVNEGRDVQAWHSWTRSSVNCWRILGFSK